MKVVPEIILIDDDEEDRWILIKALKNINSYFSITEFFDGEKALACLEMKKISNHLPVLIVLDLYLPKLNGLQILSIIKTDPKLFDIPVVLYYASCSQKDQILIDQYKAERIQKPSNEEALLHAASKMIRYIEP
jgi:CheY-like chemotaxis protein